MKIGNKVFDLENSVYIMGILNVTPDSFSDGGCYDSLDTALFHTEEMILQGADIIDIGAESTRPGHVPVSESDEIDRILPMITAIKSRFDIPLSVDTYKAKVGDIALKNGADLINDVWGFKREPALAIACAKHNAPCVIMHNRKDQNYNHLISDMIADLHGSIDIALSAGVSKDKLIIDPGVGFAKSMDDNLVVVNRLEEFNKLGYPILLGTSRKRFIGYALDLPVEEREEGTAATTVVGVMKGACIFRVHDVKGNRRAADMAMAIRNAQ